MCGSLDDVVPCCVRVECAFDVASSDTTSLDMDGSMTSYCTC